MPLMSPTLSRELYAATLACLYPLLAAWETWSAAHAPADLAGLVAGRRRAPLLVRDLACLGTPVPPAQTFDATAIPGLVEEDRAAFLGAMYVIEGSTLGGQYIARHVEPLLQLAPDRGTAYFTGYGDRTMDQWQAFRAELAALPDDQSETTVAAARAMFKMFEAALRPVAPEVQP